VVIIAAALINMLLMGDGSTLEGNKQRFGRYESAPQTPETFDAEVRADSTVS
jgi:hypothetical protein